MTTTSITPPTFDLPSNTSDYEVWCLRAPAHLDTSELLNGVTLNVNARLLQNPEPSTPSTAADISSSAILSKFKSNQDGQEYELCLEDSAELNHLRLLLTDQTDSTRNLLKAHQSTFDRYINLNSTTTSVQEELALAPSRESAPRPAFGETVGVNGAVPAMRLAYVPVPQKDGLKRRWAMPGSRIVGGAKRRIGEVDGVVGSNTTGGVNNGLSPKSAKKSKKEKKKKDKKEKKSKKTPKKEKMS